VELNAFQSLLRPQGQEALRAAAALSPLEVDFLRHYQSLARQFPPELARAALETAILRAEASTKFPASGKMYFTRQAMEQASSWDISKYRAKRYQHFDTVIDLGCSIGSDTLALASVASTIGIDLDPLRLSMARVNAEAHNLSNNAAFIQADLNTNLPFSPISYPLSPALFFDPARRLDGRRVFSVHQYNPPLSIIENWLPHFPALGIKVSPGVNLSELHSYQAELEFISLRGELKECVLWFGPLKTTSRRSTILPGPFTLTSDLPAAELQKKKLPLSEPGAYLYEPDPAVLRAGLVYNLGVRINARQLDPDIAYLTADDRTQTPFARCWEVEDWLPFNLKRLRAYLRERDIGRVTVKKRGSPLQPEVLIHDLRLRGEREKVVFLTHLRGRPIVIVCLP
jgi:SAM-dependent methyltransferase